MTAWTTGHTLSSAVIVGRKSAASLARRSLKVPPLLSVMNAK